MRKLKPVTPGELLPEEFLPPMGISQGGTKLAKIKPWADAEDHS